MLSADARDLHKGAAAGPALHVVMPDLRGYGIRTSRRARRTMDRIESTMALDAVELMRSLGFERSSYAVTIVVGASRIGSRSIIRMCRTSDGARHFADAAMYERTTMILRRFITTGSF